MAGTVRVQPEVGMKILTPYGLEEVLAHDLQYDRVTTGRGNTYGEEELRAPEAPESREPADVEAWLSGPDLILVRSCNLACSCSCTQCSYLLVIRGDRRTATHQRANEACTCGPKNECCGFPLGEL
jgi:hypothetical protein